MDRRYFGETAMTQHDRHVSVLRRTFKRAVQAVLDGELDAVPANIVEQVVELIEERAATPYGRPMAVSAAVRKELLDCWMWALNRLPGLVDR